jgi:hypothetical protein
MSARRLDRRAKWRLEDAGTSSGWLLRRQKLGVLPSLLLRLLLTFEAVGAACRSETLVARGAWRVCSVGARPCTSTLPEQEGRHMTTHNQRICLNMMNNRPFALGKLGRAA